MSEILRPNFLRFCAILFAVVDFCAFLLDCNFLYSSAVQSFTFVSMSFFFSGHRKILALVSIFVLPEWLKCKISSNLLLRSIGTTIWSSTNTKPHRIDSFSNTSLYPSGAVSRSYRLMLVLTQTKQSSSTLLIFSKCPDFMSFQFSPYIFL